MTRMLPLQDLLEHWMAGEPVPGVEYHLNDLVEVVDDAHPGERRIVVTPCNSSRRRYSSSSWRPVPTSKSHSRAYVEPTSVR